MGVCVCVFVTNLKPPKVIVPLIGLVVGSIGFRRVFVTRALPTPVLCTTRTRLIVVTLLKRSSYQVLLLLLLLFGA